MNRQARYVLNIFSRQQCFCLQPRKHNRKSQPDHWRFKFEFYHIHLEKLPGPNFAGALELINISLLTEG